MDNYYGKITMLGSKERIEAFLDNELSVLNERCEKNKQANWENLWTLVLWS